MIEIPGYKFIKELGQGGMATVYLANYLGLDREVAIKVMSPILTTDPSFAERFSREAKIVAKLKHPGIVGVYDVGQYNEFNYISMEYHANGDLKQKIEKGIKLSEVLSILKSVAISLDFAHSKGIIHRDIKPENILFDEHHKPIITDFGIAKGTDSQSQVTQVGSAVGTPRYMSPEQARGKKTDHRCDLYSLGVLFFEMVTGRAPYDADDSLAIGIKHVTDPIPLLPEKYAEFQGFLNKAMAKQPVSRFQSGRELARALEFGVAIESEQKTDETGPLITQQDDRSYYSNKKNNSQTTIIVAANRRVLPVVSILILILMGVLSVSYYAPGYMPPLDQWVNEVSGRAEKQRIKHQLQQQKIQLEQTIERLKKQLTKALDTDVVNKKELQDAEKILINLRKISPSNLAVSQGLKNIAEKYSLLANQSAMKHEFDVAQNAMTNIERLLPNSSLIETTRQQIEVFKTEYEKQLNDLKIKAEVARQFAIKKAQENKIKQQKVDKLIKSADEMVAKNHLTRPNKRNALFYFREILELDANNNRAKLGLEKLALFYSNRAKSNILKGYFKSARRDLSKLVSILPGYEKTQQLEKLLTSEQKKRKKKTSKEIKDNQNKIRGIKENNQKNNGSTENTTNDKTVEIKKPNTEKPLLIKKRPEVNPLLKLQVNALLQSAKTANMVGRSTPPSNDNAFDKYIKVLSIQVKNQQAREGINSLMKALSIKQKTAEDQGDEPLSIQLQTLHKELIKRYHDAINKNH